MKRDFLLIVIFAGIVTSCRSNDDILSQEDIKTLKIIEKKNTIKSKVKADTLLYRIEKVDEIIVPPKK